MLFDKKISKAYIRLRRPSLTDSHIQKRKNFGLFWRKKHVELFGKNTPIMFSDEKIFTVNGGLNRQNDRVYAISREQANENGGTLTLEVQLRYLYSLNVNFTKV